MLLSLYILITTAVFGISVIIWLLNSFVLPYLSSVDDEKRWTESDVQIRVVTIDNQNVVQHTVSKAQEIFSDVLVISEEDLEDINCPVQVVPDSFECNAIRKGRALEWGRQNIESGKEYILYIDEDTVIENFDGVPDCDIVQFRETPTRTDSFVSYLIEIYRTGYQFEQRGFNFYKYPLYAWGGGIAIRQSLEDEVTWDFKSITEDTSFAWRASDFRLQNDDVISFKTADQGFYNQSPGSLWSLFKQRRRWVSGTIMDRGILPLRYKILIVGRLAFWGLSPFITLNGILFASVSTPVTQSFIFTIIIGFELAILHLNSAIGIIRHRKQSKLVYLALPLTLILTFINSIGALWGLVSPASDFNVTDKSDIDE